MTIICSRCHGNHMRSECHTMLGFTLTNRLNDAQQVMRDESPMYWRGRALEDHTKEELIEIIKFQARQHASAGETINQLTDLIGYRVK